MRIAKRSSISTGRIWSAQKNAETKQANAESKLGLVRDAAKKQHVLEGNDEKADALAKVREGLIPGDDGRGEPRAHKVTPLYFAEVASSGIAASSSRGRQG